jgi:hypothetical protein
MLERAWSGAPGQRLYPTDLAHSSACQGSLTTPKAVNTDYNWLQWTGLFFQNTLAAVRAHHL